MAVARSVQRHAAHGDDAVRYSRGAHQPGGGEDAHLVLTFTIPIMTMMMIPHHATGRTPQGRISPPVPVPSYYSPTSARLELTAAARAADRERGAAQSDDVMRRADDDTAALYADLNRQVLAGAAAAELKGVGVEHTNETILHALTAATPRTRYIVGAKVCMCVCVCVYGYCTLWNGLAQPREDTRATSKPAR
jgi:hypothetical protein